MVEQQEPTNTPQEGSGALHVLSCPPFLLMTPLVELPNHHSPLVSSMLKRATTVMLTAMAVMILMMVWKGQWLDGELEGLMVT